MRTTSYSCDWCRQSIPSERMVELRATLVEGSLTPRLKAEVCDNCLAELERWIVGREDGGELVRQPVGPTLPRGGPSIEAAQKLLDNLERPQGLES